VPYSIEWMRAKEIWVRTEKNPQISPLRCAPVEMTNLFEDGIPCFQDKYEISPLNKFVVSTGAQRSGEICGFFFEFSHTLAFRDRSSSLNSHPLRSLQSRLCEALFRFGIMETADATAVDSRTISSGCTITC
jgi:hypothetical protein